MNKFGKYCLTKLVLILILVTISYYSYGQRWEGDKINTFSKDWAIGVNAGMLSFFGDISGYDNDFVGKLEHESGFGGGLIITRKIFKSFGISAQVLTGQLQGSKNNITFESSILECNINARLNILSILNSNALRNIELNVIGGIGNFVFNSTKREYYEGQIVVTNHKSRVPELVYFTGAGIQYKFSDSFSINSALTIRQCLNDKLDIEVTNPDYDYFSYFEVGISFHLQQISKAYVNNKARIAHNSSNARIKAMRYK